MGAEVKPIRDQDIPEVAGFLAANMTPKFSASFWRRMAGAPWGNGTPNRGFMLIDDGQVVGAYLAYYSRQEIEGHDRQICNLGTWCVHGGYRFHSIRLAKALLSQEQMHFTDLSPNPDVIRIDEKLGFRRLAGTDAVVAMAIPWPFRRGYRVTSDHKTISSRLGGAEARIFDDHIAAAGALHLLIESSDGEQCYVVAMRRLHQRIPFLTVLYASDPKLLKRAWRQFCSHVLRKHKSIGVIIENRILSSVPLPRRRLASPRTKLLKSDEMDSKSVNYLYSELVCEPPSDPA